MPLNEDSRARARDRLRVYARAEVIAPAIMNHNIYRRRVIAGANYELDVCIVIRPCIIYYYHARLHVSIVFCDDEGDDYRRPYTHHLCIEPAADTYSRVNAMK